MSGGAKKGRRRVRMTAGEPNRTTYRPKRGKGGPRRVAPDTVQRMRKATERNRVALLVHAERQKRRAERQKRLAKNRKSGIVGDRKVLEGISEAWEKRNARLRRRAKE